MSAPTGAGKTVVFTRFLEDLRLQDKLEPTLIIVPTKNLKEQTEARLREHGFKGNVSQVNGLRAMPDADVHITTQSGFARQINENGRGIVPERIKNIIFDEVHHIQGDSTQIALRRAFKHARIIGFTATPDYDNKRQLSNILPDLIHEITPTEAIDEGLITPYVTLGLPTYADMRDVVIQGKEYHQKFLRQAIETDERDKLIASYYRQNMHGIPTLFNMSWVEHAEKMASTLREFGVKAETVHGGMHPDHEARILQAFEAGEIEVITQVRKLGEGYDSKRISAVVNVSPTKSRVLAQQRVGRAQRINEAQPDKVTLVVECIDQDYRGKPAFYGSEAVTGLWAYGVDPSVAKKFTAGDFHAFYNPEQLEQWYSGGWAPAGQTQNVIQQVNADAFETIQPLPKSVKNPLATPIHRPRRARRIDQPVEERTNEAAEQRKRQHTHIRQEKKRRLKDEAADFFDRETEVGLDDKLRSFRTPEEQMVASYIIYGEEAPSVSIKPYVLKQVLSELAGSDLMQDKDALSRFRQISSIASGQTHIFIEDEETGQTVKNKKGNQSKSSAASFVIDKPVFINANCEPDKDANDDELREHTNKFFPERGRLLVEDKAMCYTCKSRAACLDYAIDSKQLFGIWGGMSERQRRKLRTTRRDKGQSAYEHQQVEFYKKDVNTFKNKFDCPVMPELLPLTETPVSIR